MKLLSLTFTYFDLLDYCEKTVTIEALEEYSIYVEFMKQTQYIRVKIKRTKEVKTKEEYENLSKTVQEELWYDVRRDIEIVKLPRVSIKDVENDY